MCVDVMSLVENIVKKNRSRLSIAVLLTTLICTRLMTTHLFFGLPTEVLGIWGLLVYCWKRLENTFPTVYYMPPKF